MSDYFVPYLSDGDYYTAFKTYAELCDKFVTQARTDVSYGIGNLDDLDYSIPLTAEDWITAVCVNIVIGIRCCTYCLLDTQGQAENRRYAARCE